MRPRARAPAPSAKVVVFTDGACSGNPGPGGWGAVMASPLGLVKELGGAEARTTNNRMEITAALESLRALSRVKQLSSREIQLYTDSTYLIRGITGWVQGWKKRNWKTQDGSDVANRELWEALEEVIHEHRFEVDWLYVPGHKGYPGNERCDQIAVAFSKGVKPNLYQGPRKDYKVDLNKLPAPSPLPDPSRKKNAPVYLSLVNGRLHRDQDWKSCEARVKGATGAKFKKVTSPEEEEEILEAWGIR